MLGTQPSVIEAQQITCVRGGLRDSRGVMCATVLKDCFVRYAMAKIACSTGTTGCSRCSGLPANA